MAKAELVHPITLPDVILTMTYGEAAVLTVFLGGTPPTRVKHIIEGATYSKLQRVASHLIAQESRDDWMGRPLDDVYHALISALKRQDNV